MFVMNSLVVLVLALFASVLGNLQEYNGFDCSQLDDGNYPEPSGNPPGCNSFYWSCIAHAATKMDCQAGLFFDPERNWCESKDNVVVCGGQRATTMPPSGDSAITLAPSVFDCSEKADGLFPNPKDSCSGIYYTCSGGFAQEHHCQGGLIFDPETMVCDKPENTFICTGTRATTLITEAPATYAPPQTYAMDCTGKPDGSHPHPTEPCSQSFFICSNGHISLIKCAGKMFYDETIQRCEAWRNVFACSGMAPEVLPDAIETKAPETYQHPDMDCTNMADGPYPDPKNQCSNRYFDCSNGLTHERRCPLSLMWNAEEVICDSYDNIFACTGIRKVPTIPTLAPTSPPRIPEFPCKADGFYLDPLNDCSSIYWVCSKGIDSKMLCGEGLKFDIEKGVCDYWDNVFSCSGKRPEPTYAPAPTTNDHRDVPDLPVDCKDATDGDYRDPHMECSQKYYSCSGGVATERMCGDGLLFDPELLQCENHDDIPACTGKARTYPAPTEAPLPIEEHPFDCTQLKDGNVAAGPCKGYYWTCVGGTTYMRVCQPGLSYDDEENQCDSPSNVRSCGGHRTIAPKPDQTYNKPAPVFPVDCTKLADGFYSDPADDCSLTYYVCSNGVTSELHCAAALKFDITINRCELKVYVPACGGTPRADTYNQAPVNSYNNARVHKHTRGTRPPQLDNGSFAADTKAPLPPKAQNTYQRLRTSAPLPPHDQGSYNPNSY